jgi:hypothetical protein
MPQRSRQSRASSQPVQYNKGKSNYPKSQPGFYNHPQSNQYQHPPYSNMGGNMPPSNMYQNPQHQDSQYQDPQYMNHGNGQFYPPQQYPQHHPIPSVSSKPKKIAVADAIGLLSKRLGLLEEKIELIDMSKEDIHAQQNINSTIIQKLESLQEQMSSINIQPTVSPPLSGDATENNTMNEVASTEL